MDLGLFWKKKKKKNLFPPPMQVWDVMHKIDRDKTSFSWIISITGHGAMVIVSTRDQLEQKNIHLCIVSAFLPHRMLKWNREGGGTTH